MWKGGQIIWRGEISMVETVSTSPKSYLTGDNETYVG